MRCYAVVDTNVIVSALLTKNPDVATLRVLNAMADGEIIPLYSDKIFEEYRDVLFREKFHFDSESIRDLLSAIKEIGIDVQNPRPTDEEFTDKSDMVFYEVVMEKRDEGSYLVTGNRKHFPERSFIVSPAEMVDILEKMRIRCGWGAASPRRRWCATSFGPPLRTLNDSGNQLRNFVCKTRSYVL